MIKQQQSRSLLSATCSRVMQSCFPPCSLLLAPSVWGVWSPQEHRLLFLEQFAPVPLNITCPPLECCLTLWKWLAPATTVGSLLEAYGEAIAVKFGFLLLCTTLASSP